MNTDQIREVVKITIDELTKRKLLSVDNYQTMLKTVEDKLNNFFNNKGGNAVSHALNSMSDDPYIDIIFLQYRDGKTLEFISEIFNKDISTIKRNKKRLVISLYELLEE